MISACKVCPEQNVGETGDLRRRIRNNRYTITTNIEVLKNLLSVRQSGYNVKIGENVIFITGFLYISLKTKVYNN